MELGELVAVAIPDVELEDKCPFSHEKPNPDEKNELGGIGTKLGKNMANGTGIHKSKPPIGRDFSTGDKMPDPRKRDPKILGVTITVNNEVITLNGSPLEYPLTCAAHHLIPAQEALKGHKILKFMCKDGETQDFRKSGNPDPKAVSGSKVWGNVAYNVNGRHNGVWLPGNYAVGGGLSGIEVWKSKSSAKRKKSVDGVIGNWRNALDLSEEEWDAKTDKVEQEGPEQPPESASDNIYMLTGTNYKIDNCNPKWAYVKAAMDKADGYFHDRHKPYSDEVAKYLKKICEVYEKRYDSSLDSENPCKECKDAKKPDGAKDSLVGPPYEIVARLEMCSRFFERHLTGVTATNIYTSKWVNAWMTETDRLSNLQSSAKKQKP